MSASKKYKSMETSEMEDTENHVQKKFADGTGHKYFCRTNNASAGDGQNAASGGGINSTNSHTERKPNFSMLNNSNYCGYQGAFLNKMAINNSSKPGDVKKIIIKNFKSTYSVFTAYFKNLQEECKCK